MHIRDAVASRYSCRAFLPTPVPETTVREILEGAARAPSGGNVQPWNVHALAGEALQELKAQLAPRMGELPKGEGAEYDIYPPDMKEPYQSRRYEVGDLLYRAIGVPREDRLGRYRQYARNFVFFDAPVGLFFSIDRDMGPPQWSDLGMYIQTVMLLARGHGLHTCAQEAWTFWHRTVSAHLSLPPEQMLFCGMALGHADPDAAINRWRSPRVPLSGFATFRGFARNA
ncbi:MAG TPA: nitroreductase [Xanthobacteraceae bacterium]|nr:nitroreductase [Xanthobacteraceae bacterium]